MPDLDAIEKASPWALLVFVLLSGFVASWTALIRGWIVMGHQYRKEEERADKAIKQAETAATQAERTATALETLSDFLKDVLNDRGGRRASGR